jgi:hypothetical protein
LAMSYFIISLQLFSTNRSALWQRVCTPFGIAQFVQCPNYGMGNNEFLFWFQAQATGSCSKTSTLSLGSQAHIQMTPRVSSPGLMRPRHAIVYPHLCTYMPSWLKLGHLCLPLSGYIWTMNSSGFFPFIYLCVLYPHFHLIPEFKILGVFLL